MEKLLNVKDVARILGIHRKTVIELIRNGKIKGGKVGMQYRVKASDLEEYIQNLEV